MEHSGIGGREMLIRSESHSQDFKVEARSDARRAIKAELKREADRTGNLHDLLNWVAYRVMEEEPLVQGEVAGYCRAS